jgi:hypothetical protein
MDLSSLLPPPTEVNDTHKTYSVAAGCAVMCVVSSCVVLGRLYFRMITRTFGLDDWSILVALIIFIGWTACAVYVNLYGGIGKPLWEVTVGEFEIQYKSIVGAAHLYPAMSAAIRISLLLFYRRMFVTNGSKVYRWIIYALIAVQVIYMVIFATIPVVNCHPYYSAWDVWQHPTLCNNDEYILQTTALYSMSLALDIALLAVPLWPVWNLQMPLKKRLSVAGLFLIGTSATVGAAYKLAIFVIEAKRAITIDPTNPCKFFFFFLLLTHLQFYLHPATWVADSAIYLQ